VIKVVLRFVRAEVVELDGVKNLVDLKLTFSRRVEVDGLRVVNSARRGL
jgi:hypothetical protein